MSVFSTLSKRMQNTIQGDHRAMTTDVVRGKFSFQQAGRAPRHLSRGGLQ